MEGAINGNPTPSPAGPPGSVRNSSLGHDLAKQMGIVIVWYFSAVSYDLVCISFQPLVEKKQNGFRSVLRSMKEKKCVELH
jgi:hypothetical protein